MHQSHKCKQFRDTIVLLYNSHDITDEKETKSTDLSPTSDLMTT